ncbi:hypothetical protein D3C83_275670 [compost metagenome]
MSDAQPELIFFIKPDVEIGVPDLGKVEQAALRRRCKVRLDIEVNPFMDLTEKNDPDPPKEEAIIASP